MILSKILALIGLAVPHMPDDRIVDRAMRHARAASWQHGVYNARVQSAALDRISEHVADDRPDEIARSAESLKETIGAMLGKLP